MQVLLDLFSKFGEISKGNPILATLLGMYGVGVITYLCKDVPKRFTGFLRKQFTTSASIANHNACFFRFMQLLERDGIASKSRKIKFMNGKWGDSDDIIKSIGGGIHCFRFRGTLLWVELVYKESSDHIEKLEVILTKIGRSHKLFDDLLLELVKPQESSIGTTKAYKHRFDKWELATSYPSRSFDTIFMEKAKKEQLIHTIEMFLSSEELYRKRGIPYQLGILLEGPPGTGKTSLIDAIAGKFGKELYILSATDLNGIQYALSNMPSQGILVIEDVDASNMTHSRKEAKADVQVTPLSTMTELNKSAFSEILNGIDGLVRKHGRILIMTTNHMDKLDPALLRGGRVDLTIHMGFATIETFVDFLRVFYGENEKFAKIAKIREVSMSGVQADFFTGLAMVDILDKYVEEWK